MKRLFLLASSLFLCFFSAFQYELPLGKDPGVMQWVEKANKADKEYLYDSLHHYSSQIIAYYQQKGKGDLAREWYYSYFQAIINDMNLSYEDQLRMIESMHPDIALSQKPLSLCDYYTARTQFHVMYGEVDSCEHYFQLAEPFMNKHYDAARQVYLYSIVANILMETPLKSRVLWKKADALVQQNRDKLSKDFNLMLAFYQAGSVAHYELGEYEKSIQLNQELLDRYSAKMEPIEVSIAYSDIAASYSQLEDFQSAVDYYVKAIDFNKTADIPLEHKIISLNNAAAAFSSNGDKKNARPYVQQALDLLAQAEDNESIKKDRIRSYLRLFDIHLEEHRDSAMYYLKKAESLSKQMNAYDIHSVIGCYQSFYDRIGNYVLSLDYARKYVDDVKSKFGSGRTLAQAYNRLSGTAEKLGHLEDAWQAHLESWASIYLKKTRPQMLDRTELKDILHLGTFITVLNREISLLESSLQHPQNPLKATIENIFACAKLSAKVLELQSSSFKSEGSKMEKLAQEAQAIYERAIRLAIQLYQKTKQQSYFQEAFQLAEQSKSMLLMDALQESHAASFAGIPDSLLEKERSLQRQIGRAEKAKLDALLSQDEALAAEQEQIAFQARHEAKVLESRLEKEYPEYYNLKYAAPIQDLSQIQAQIDDKTAILEYVEGEEHIYRFTITKQSTEVQIIANDSTEHDRMELFLKSVMDPQGAVNDPVFSYNTLTQNAHHYYKKLIPTLPASIERIIVIPDGRLSYLPFDILLKDSVAMTNDEMSIDYSAPHYLIQQYRINYNYSIGLWQHQQKTEKQVVNGRMLAMAASYNREKDVLDTRNPRERKTRSMMDDLPGAKSEVEGLSKEFAGEFLQGTDSNEKLFKEKASKFGILHLAMHGLVNSRDPEYSSLAFTENGDSLFDNFLYAYEIKQLGLHAGLVVLSACETGLGKYQRGEGVVSIGRGFMYAGAPSVLMTLWSLNDQSGAIIVQQFYRNLQAGMDKDEAIRQAKLQYIREHHGAAIHPALWACFVQVGDYSNIQVSDKNEGGYLWYSLGAGGLLGLVAMAMWWRKREA